MKFYFVEPRTAATATAARIDGGSSSGSRTAAKGGTETTSQELVVNILNICVETKKLSIHCNNSK